MHNKKGSELLIKTCTHFINDIKYDYDIIEHEGNIILVSKDKTKGVTLNELFSTVLDTLYTSDIKDSEEFLKRKA